MEKKECNVVLGLFLTVLFTVMAMPFNVFSQRVFSPGEDGIMMEIKEGPQAGKWGVNRSANFPRLMETILQEGCKIYLYSEDEIDLDEISVSQVGGISNIAGKPLFPVNKRKFGIKKISDSIYEIELDYGFFHGVTNYTPGSAGWSDKIVIGLEPNKKHKKEGKEPKYWYANFTQRPYYSNEICRWSDEQAIRSITQLLRGESVSEQMFASIKPDQSPIQYVVVQNAGQLNTPVAPAMSQAASNDPMEVKAIESDIDINIPYSDVKNENAFAVIIANEEYNRVANVPFAKRDGNKIRDYLIKTMGFDKTHISLLENATLNDMRYELNRLSKISEAYQGNCSFIIYYCGHGIPDEKNGNGYLLPVDGYGNDVSTAYSLDELYSQLGNLDSKRTILVTDACFSGANKSGDMLVAARGVAMRAKANQANGKLIAFSACQGDETAYSYNEKGHGLLTYYFLKKLQETGGKTTLGELEEYIVDNVGKTAIVINGKTQTPKVSVSPELKDVWREKTLVE